MDTEEAVRRSGEMRKLLDEKELKKLQVILDARAKEQDNQDRKDKLAQIDLVQHQKDILGLEKDKMSATDPLSFLSPQDRYLQQMKDLEKRNTLVQQGISKGANEVAGSDQITEFFKKNPQAFYQKYGMTPPVASTSPIATPGISMGRPDILSPTTPNTGIKPSNDNRYGETAVDQLGRENSLSQYPQEQTPLSQKYTDAYMNFSESPLGNMLNLPNTNRAIQGSFSLGDDLGNAALGGLDWLISPHKKNKKLIASPYSNPY